MEVEPESLSSWSDGFEKWSCFFLFFSFLFFCCWDILKHLLKKKCYYDFYVSNVLNKIHGINYSISSPPFPKSEFPFLRIYPRLSFFFFFFIFTGLPIFPFLLCTGESTSHQIRYGGLLLLLHLGHCYLKSSARVSNLYYSIWLVSFTMLLTSLSTTSFEKYV